MSKLRLFLLTGFLAAAVAPLYGCGSECGPGTTEQDGACVLVAEGCGDGTILSNKQCIVDTTGCGQGTTLVDEQCVPSENSCADGTTFDQELRVCVPNTEIVCGEATEANAEGICEPSGEACGPKTELDDQGRCIVEAAACGQGTTLNSNTGVCVLGDAACGAGLALGDSGQCVPTEDVCDTGTIFDADSRLCLPDACQEGDVLVNGICMNPIEQAANDADVFEKENNDPALGGTADTLTVNAVDGEAFSFAGIIGAPTDLDGDSDVDQDIDVFEFEATTGDWLQIGVQSNGLPAPAFVVNGPNGYERWSQISGAAQTARHIVIPEDGSYTVTVLPSLELQSPEVGPSGADDWSYVGTLRAIATPTPTDKDITSGTTQLDGQLTDLSDNLFNITNLAPTDLVTIKENSIGADSDATVYVWADATTLHATQEVHAGEPMTFSVPSTGTAWVLVDWQKANGSRVGFDLSATITGSATTVTVPDGATETLTFEVNLFDRIVASQTNTASADLEIAINDSSGTAIATGVLAPGEELPAIAFDSADHTIEVTNTSGAATDVTLTANIIPPADLGQIADDGTSASSPITQLSDSKAYYKFTANAGQVIAFIHENTEGEEIDYTIFDETGAQIDSDTSVDAYSDSSFIGSDYRWNYSDTAVTWLLETEATADLNNQIVEVHSLTPTNIGSVSPTTSASLTSSSAIAGELSGFHMITFDAAMNFTGSLAPTGTEDVDFYLHDMQGNEISYAGGGGDIAFGGVIETAGTFFVRTECDDACNGYDITISGAASSENLGLLAGNTITDSTILPNFFSGQAYTVNFSVGAGQIIEVGQDNDDENYQRGTLYDSSGTELGYEASMYPLSYTGYSGPERIHHFSENGGDYTFVLEGQSSSSVNQHVEIRVIEPHQLGPVSLGQTVTNNDPLDVLRYQYYVHEVTFAEAGVFAGIVTPTDSTEELDVTMYDMQFNSVDSWSGSAGPAGFGGELTAAGTYLFVAACVTDTCTGVDFEAGLVESEVTLGSLSADSSTDHTIGNFSNGQPFKLNFNVPAGQVIEISHDNSEAEDHDAELYNANGDRVAYDTSYQPRSYSSPNYLYYYSKDGGDFTLELVGANATTSSEVRIRLLTPNNIGQLDTAGNTVSTTVTDTCADGQSYFQLVDFTSPMNFDATLSPAASEDLDFYMHSLSYDEEIYEYSSGGADVVFTGIATYAGTHLVRIECDDAATGYTLDMSNGVSIEENLGTLAAGATTSTPIASFADEQVQIYTFTVPAGHAFEIGQDNVESYDHNVWLRDANGSELVYDSFFYATSYSSNEWVYWYAHTDTTYSFVLEAEDPATDQTVTIRTFVPTDLGTLQNGDTATHSVTTALAESKSDMYLVTFGQDGWLSAETVVPNSEDTDLFVYDTSMNELATETASTPINARGIDLSAGTYVLRMSAYDATPSYDFNVSNATPMTGTPDFLSAPNILLPDDDTTGITDTLTASGCTTIVSVDVWVQFTHADTGDPAFALTSPAGTTVVLRETDAGGSNGTVETVSTWYPAQRVPVGDMGLFSGETGDGTWTLKASDEYSGDLGNLDEWGVTLNCQ